MAVGWSGRISFGRFGRKHQCVSQAEEPVTSSLSVPSRECDRCDNIGAEEIMMHGYTENLCERCYRAALVNGETV